MKQILLAVLCIALAGCASLPQKSVSGTTYAFQIPEDVVFARSPQREYYGFVWGTGPGSRFLRLYPRPLLQPYPKGTPECVLDPLIEYVERQFEDDVKHTTGFKGIISKAKRRVKAGPFSGHEVLFAMQRQDGTQYKLYVLLLWDGQRVWDGSIRALSRNDITRAYNILSTAKRIANK